jgi:hypothetical protein
MTEEEYGITLATEPTGLLRVPHEQRVLTIAYPVFGDFRHQGLIYNLERLHCFYLHPTTGKRITFREPTTAESISAIAYKFEELAKREIFMRPLGGPESLFTGRVVSVTDGVFVNPPRDSGGNLFTDEKILKSFLKGIEPIKVGKGRIYISPNSKNLTRFVRDFGFAEFGSFRQGDQDSRDFAEGGLARVSEHTEQPAEKLLKVTATDNFSEGVRVYVSSGESFLSFSPRVSSWVSSGERSQPRREFFVSTVGDYQHQCGNLFGVLDGDEK